MAVNYSDRYSNISNIRNFTFVTHHLNGSTNNNNKTKRMEKRIDVLKNPTRRFNQLRWKILKIMPFTNWWQYLKQLLLLLCVVIRFNFLHSVLCAPAMSNKNNATLLHIQSIPTHTNKILLLWLIKKKYLYKLN